jgi:drug/metabolite transporter (DMT)-like permease
LIALILSIVASTLIFVVFKLFDRFKVNIFQAIVVNYLVACSCGLLLYSGDVKFGEISSAPWFYYTMGLGCLFIIVFNLMAITTQRSGLSVVSVATKMSLVIPILFGLLYYKESLGLYKLIGISLALIAVYLASIKSKNGFKIRRGDFLLPLLVFLGSGIIDTGIKFLEESYVSENEVPIFSATIFGTASVIGIVIILIQQVRGKFKFDLRNIIGGFVLGITNYFSVYFLVHALRSDLYDSSGIFTVNNVAIVTMSTLIGIALFKEKLLIKNWLGIILAVISIFMIAISGA